MRSSMPPKYEGRYLIETEELTKSFGKENEILAVDSLTGKAHNIAYTFRVQRFSSNLFTFSPILYS
jgi:hypothetical protein